MELKASLNNLIAELETLTLTDIRALLEAIETKFNINLTITTTLKPTVSTDKEIYLNDVGKNKALVIRFLANRFKYDVMKANKLVADSVLAPQLIAKVKASEAEKLLEELRKIEAIATIKEN